MHAFNVSTPEAEAGRSLWDPGHTGLHGEFQAMWGYKETLVK